MKMGDLLILGIKFNGTALQYILNDNDSYWEILIKCIDSTIFVDRRLTQFK